MRLLSLPELELSLFIVPKTGGTTIANWVRFLKTGDQKPGPHVYEEGWLWDDQVRAEKLRIRRDPVDRFVSGYRNYRDMRGLRLNFADFVEKFEGLMEEDDDIRHHFQHQYLFYPYAIEDYEHVFDFSQFHQVKLFLESRSGKRLPEWHLIQAHYQNFEVSASQVERIRDFYSEDYARGFCEPSRSRVTAVNFPFRIDKDEKESEFHVIASTLRSGSSLCGHLFAEAGWVWFAGETHHHFFGEDQVAAASKVIVAKGDGRRKGAPPCAKILRSNYVKKGSGFVADRASRVYLLLRHPLAVWRSQKEAGWDGCELGLMADQFQFLRELVEKVEPEKLKVVSYYELTSPEGREKLFGRTLDHYSTNEQTGKSGWGDAGPLISSGKIREVTLKEDLRRAMPEVWMDLRHPDLIRAVGEFRTILKLVSREELDLPWPKAELLAAKTLRIGGGPASENSLKLSLAEVKRDIELTCENDVFERVVSEELAHRLEPPQLTRVLTQLRKALRPSGIIRLSTPNLAFVMKVLAGEERDFTTWYCKQFLFRHRAGSGDGAAVANHLVRSWGHNFSYDLGALQECLEAAGFTNVREVTVGDEESSERMPEGFYRKERLVVEATALSEAEWNAKLTQEADCLYVDCGFHRGGGFRELFGKGVIDARYHCLGFEPNPDLPLPEWVQQAAVGNFDGEAELQIQSPKPGPYSEMGSTILPEFRTALKEVEKSQEYNTGDFERSEAVPVVRLASFLQEAHRELAPVRTVVKIDIEGAEKEVVEDLLESGAAELIDELHIEWHAWTGVYPEDVPETLTIELRKRGVVVVVHH